MTASRLRPQAPPLGPGPAPPLPVLLVVDSLDGGNAERYVVDLAIALHQRGWPVHVACSTDGVRAAALADAGVPVTVLLGELVKRRVSGRYARALHRLVAEQRPAVVHAHLFASAAAAVQAVRDLPVPLVVTEHIEAPWRDRRDRAVSAWCTARPTTWSPSPPRSGTCSSPTTGWHRSGSRCCCRRRPRRCRRADPSR